MLKNKLSRIKALLFIIPVILVSAVISRSQITYTDSVKITPLSTYSEGNSLTSDTCWNLFDGDTGTTFDENPETVRVIVDLGNNYSVESLMFYGDASYRVNVYWGDTGSWNPLSGVIDIDLDTFPNSWNSFDVDMETITGKLLFELIPSALGSGLKGIGEIEIWGLAGKKAISGKDALINLAKSGDFPQNVELIQASPYEGEVSRKEANKEMRFTFNAQRDPRVYKESYLLYESKGLANWAGTRLSINNKSFTGGFWVGRNDQWIEQVQPLNPVWLERGNNSFTFSAPEDMYGEYWIRNVRVVTLMDDGKSYVKELKGAGAVNSLFDEDLSTSWTFSPASGGEDIVDIYFNRPVQAHNLSIHIKDEISGKLDYRYLASGEWVQPQGGDTISLNPFEIGWNDITLRFPENVTSEGIRLIFQSSGQQGGNIAELSIAGSAVGEKLAYRKLQINSPENGEFYGRKAFISGWVDGPGAENAEIYIAGRKVVRSSDDLKNYLGRVVSKDEAGYENQGDSESWQVEVKAVYPDGSVVRKTVFLSMFNEEVLLPVEEKTSASGGGSGDEEEEFDASGEEEVEEWVSPGKGKKIGLKGTRLHIPPGALWKDRKIKIKVLKKSELPPLDPGMVNVTAPDHGYRFTPHGLKFRKKVALKMPYDPYLIPAGIEEDEVWTYYYDEKAGHWKKLGRVKVDKEHAVVESETDHFTDMINAVLVTPEHPEALTYNPNTIKDIKAADPGAGINLIEPPQANNMGDARLSYPIEIPAGRRGMQPQLSVAYNSSGGNGWLGLGWDLSVPSITIDTRWGVPRYDGDKETETYMLNGEMLTPVAHRGELQDRPTEDTKEFHTRVEGQFRDIIRHGGSPAEYWWEVTDKSGTRHFYGGDGQNQDAASVLGRTRTPNPGVFKWMLKKSIDTNGNTVTYSYDSVCDTGVKGADKNYSCDNSTTEAFGHQLYLSGINYTGHNGSSGAYTISFKRDSQLSDYTRRPDVSIDARGGFKVVTAELLREIDVIFSESSVVDGETVSTNNTVRSYELEYEDGVFNKTRLRALIQKGKDGTEFNRHEFEYYDDSRNADGNYKGFVSAGTWNTHSDQVIPLKVPSELDATAISGSTGYSAGGQIYVGVGLYYEGKKFSVGGKAGYNEGKREGVLSLIDINGDGLPDKVFRDKGKSKVYYRKGKLQDNGSLTFTAGDTGRFFINGLPALSEEEFQSVTMGVEGYVFVVSFHKDMTETLNKGAIYFSDVNGDGLVDLAYKGKVLFNHIENDNPVFTENSYDTPAYLGSGTLDTTGLIDDEYFASLEEGRADEYPLIDAVKRWIAPYGGTVNVTGGVALIGSPPESYETADGVRVVIQHNSEEMWKKRILAGDDETYYPTPVNAEGEDEGGPIALSVEKGDRIYFRVQSIDDGAYDQVSWDAAVSYKDVDTSITDVNNLPVYTYNGIEDFVLAGRSGGVVMPIKGNVRIVGDLLKKGKTTDDITMVILKNGEPIFSRTLKSDETGTIPLNEEVTIDVRYTYDVNNIDKADLDKVGDPSEYGDADASEEELDKLEFLVKTDSPIDLTQIEWTPELYYVSAVDQSVPVFDANDYPQIRMNPPYDIDMYPESILTSPQESWISTKEGSVIAIPRISFDFYSTVKNNNFFENFIGKNEDLVCKVSDKIKNSELIFTVKRKGVANGELLLKKKISISDCSMPEPYELALLIPGLKEGDELFYDFSSREPELAQYLINSEVTFSYVGEKYIQPPLDGNVLIEPKLEINLPEDEEGNPYIKDVKNGGKFLLALVLNDELIEKRIVTPQNYEYKLNEVLASLSGDYDVKEEDKIYFELLTLETSLENYIARKDYSVTVNKNQSWSVPDDIFMPTEPDSDKESHYSKDLTWKNNLTIYPSLTFREEVVIPDGNLVLKVLRGKTVLGLADVSINDGEVPDLSSIAIEVAVEGGDTLTFAYVTSSLDMVNTLSEFGTVVSWQRPLEDSEDDATEEVTEEADALLLVTDIPINFHLEESAPAILHSSQPDGLFPDSYRGWAYTAYNGNDCTLDSDGALTACLPINENDFILNDAKAEHYESIYQGLDKNSKYDDHKNSDFRVFPLVPLYNMVDREKLLENDNGINAEGNFFHWGGHDEFNWVSAGIMSSSRLGLDYIHLPRSADLAAANEPARSGFAGAGSVPRMSMGTMDASGAGLILSGSWGEGDSESLLDFKDMNGDRFPDVIAPGRIQFTRPNGALSETLGFGNIRTSENESENIGMGGNPASALMNVLGTISGKNTGGNSVSTEPSFSFSGGIGGGSSEVQENLIDMNGDGLPDRVKLNGMVALNNGYGFEKEENWYVTAIDKSKSANISMGGGYNSGGINWMSGGININYARTFTEQTLMDINGDGMPDMVWRGDDNILVAFNTGTGFDLPVVWASGVYAENDTGGISTDLPENNTLAQSDNITAGGGVYLGFTISFTVAFVKICININPAINANLSTSRQELSVMDVNGDGYADHVFSEKNSSMKVALNPHGRTNLLKEITRPLGATINLDYERSGNTYAQPQSRWVMNKVEINDGHTGDGVDRLLMTYMYEDGYHDRYERDFYGYGKVIEETNNTGSNDDLYRQVIKAYKNGNIYEKGLLESETVADAQGKVYTSTKNSYGLYDVNAETIRTLGGTLSKDMPLYTLFPRLDRTDKGFYEGTLNIPVFAGFTGAGLPQGGKATYTRYEYDNVGNVTYFLDAGDSGDSDNVSADITYYDFSGSYIKDRPEKITVTGGDGQTYRKRTASYDGSGNLLTLTSEIAPAETDKDGSEAKSAETAISTMTYDSYGNIHTFTGAKNKDGESEVLTYSYDGQVHSYVENIDFFNSKDTYSSSAEYDYKYGKPLSTTDLNSNVVTYEYDSFGRTEKIYGPYDEAPAIATIDFDYHHNDSPAWALTKNKEHWEGSETIDTILYTDGLKRVLQTKKEAEKDDDPGMTVSGKVIFDGLGRSIEQGQPTFESGYATAFKVEALATNPTEFEYDVLGRQTKVTLPDSAFTTMAYGFEDSLFLTHVTDAEGKEKKTLKDLRDAIRTVKEKLSGSWVTTSYEYNPMTEITLVTDDADHETSVTYDMLGRRLSINNPDTGLVTYKYDPAGNLDEKVTPNLRDDNKAIKYEYTGNRLDEIDYPDMADVKYEYGAPNAEFNRAGRIVRVENGDMWAERFYGKLGETVKEIKSIRSDVPSRAWPEYTTEYSFDSFGRMRWLKFPDGEVLTYSYDKGGLLDMATGKKGSHEYTYLDNIVYDEFGQRTKLELGNGTETVYEYYDKTRRLKHIVTTSPEGDILQNMEYEYDRVGNVKETINGPFVTVDDINKTVTQTYTYDDLHRLDIAEGSYQVDPDRINQYLNDFDYSSIGNITNKVQTNTVFKPSDGSTSPRPQTTYDYTYLYEHETKPHAPTHIGGDTYNYDLNGNMISRINDRTKKTRLITWDEENRIATTEDQGKETIYRYDDSGMRVMKRGKYGEVVYVNENFVIRNGEVASKHVFAGNTRIATKLVMKENKTNASKKTYERPADVHGHSGTAPEKSNGRSIGNDKNDRPEKERNVHEDQGRHLGQEKNADKTNNGKGQDKGNQGNNNEKQHRSNVNLNADLPGNSEKGIANALSNGKGHKYGIYRRLGSLGYEVNENGDIVTAGTGEDGGFGSYSSQSGETLPEEKAIFYYHGDHLGSSSVITDKKGRTYQHLEYFPYGETWVDEHRNRTNLPYKFTGKELDPETGLYYFGARYYEPRISVWISADPIMGKYLPTGGKKDRGRSLPGMGGVYNPINISMYHYAGLNPILFVDPDGNAKILMDPGHGAHKTGATNSSFNEKNINLSFSNKVATVLHNLGHEVSSTRFGDNHVSLSKRADMADKEGSDFFVSIHVDSHDRGSEMSVLYQKNKDGKIRPEQKQFADLIKTDMKKRAAGSMKVESWGENLGVLRGLDDSIGVLLEVGNSQSATDTSMLSSQDKQWSHANDIGHAIHHAISELEK